MNDVLRTLAIALLTVTLTDLARGDIADDPLATEQREFRIAVDTGEAELVDLRVVSEREANRVVETMLDGKPVTLLLTPHNVRSAGFEVWVQDGTGALRRVDDPPRARTVRGTVSEWEGAVVTGSLIDGKLNASIRTMDHGNWYVQPAPAFLGAESETAHVVHRGDAVLPSVGRCGLDHADVRQPEDAIAPDVAPGSTVEEPRGEDGGSYRGASLQATEISFDADVEFFNLKGGSVAATVDDIESVLVAVDAIYRGQVGISYVLNRIVVRTAEPDPYTSFDGGTLLDQFRDEWEDHFEGQERDVAHLMTGRNMTGNEIGRAYVGEVCRRDGIFANGGYGYSQSTQRAFSRRVALTAHELGHNWDAGHCSDSADPTTGCGGPGFSFDADCGIMCACISACTGSVTQFGASALSSIISHRDSRDCLHDMTTVTYVDASHSEPELGSSTAPFNTFREGVWATDFGGRVIIAGGVYDADRTLEILNRPLTLEAWPGTGSVTIGQ